MTFVNWPDKELRPVAGSVSFGTNNIGPDLQRNRKRSVPNWSASVFRGQCNPIIWGWFGPTGWNDSQRGLEWAFAGEDVRVKVFRTKKKSIFRCCFLTSLFFSKFKTINIYSYQFCWCKKKYMQLFPWSQCTSIPLLGVINNSLKYTMHYKRTSRVFSPAVTALTDKMKSTAGYQSVNFSFFRTHQTIILFSNKKKL